MPEPLPHPGPPPQPWAITTPDVANRATARTAIISFFIFFSSPVIFAFQALPFAHSFCNPYAKSRADFHLRNNNMKILIKFFLESLDSK
jgi:hypothetical protein